ncbi:reverse transcriptase domain-containing protein [Tanacetum coccineum]
MGKTELTQADLEGQSYEVVTSFYPDVVHLQFQMEECHKMLIDQIDWTNPEARNMLVKVGKFTFPVDFVILEIEEDNKVPLIFGRPFLHTANAVIRVKQKQLNLGVGTERMIFHIDSVMKHSYSNDDTCFSIDIIDEILEEDFEALLDKGSEIIHSIKGTILEEKLFAEFDEFMAMIVDENSESKSDTKEPPFEKITFNTDYKIKTSLEEPPTDLELKPFPNNMEYVFLEEPSFLPIIISSQLSEENKNKLIYVFKRHKCMPAIFHDMIEESVKVFMDDFFVFGSSFNHCLNHLDKMLQRCKDAHLSLTGKMSLHGKRRNCAWSQGHAGFYRRFIKDFSKIACPFTKFLEKDTPFEFNDECHNALKNCNPDLIAAAEKQMFQLHELDELRHQYPSGYVELYGKDGKIFIVNHHRLKLYHEEEDYNDQREAVTPFFLKE